MHRINILFFLGLFLAIGGCNSIFLVDGWLVIGGLGMYLAGEILVWFSGTSMFNRLLAFLLPAVIFLSIYSITSDDRVREPAVWLIPPEYSGPLAVFLEEPCGEKETREGEIRRYAVDASGQLFSTFKRNPGVVVTPSEFYYTDGRQRVRLKALLLPEDTAAVTQVWRDSTGQPVYAFPGEAIRGYAGETKVTVETAFVGTYRQYLDYVKSSPLPDSLDPSWEPVILDHRAACR